MRMKRSSAHGISADPGPRSSQPWICQLQLLCPRRVDCAQQLVWARQNGVFEKFRHGSLSERFLTLIWLSGLSFKRREVWRPLQIGSSRLPSSCYPSQLWLSASQIQFKRRKEITVDFPAISHYPAFSRNSSIPHQTVISRICCQPSANWPIQLESDFPTWVPFLPPQTLWFWHKEVHESQVLSFSSRFDDSLTNQQRSLEVAYVE